MCLKIKSKLHTLYNERSTLYIIIANIVKIYLLKYHEVKKKMICILSV